MDGDSAMAEHDIIDGHAGPTVQTYLVIFGALCVFTAVSFLVNWGFGIGSHTGMAIILAVAVCKATLVAMFFMHLKFEWFKLYFLIVPVMILCVLMILVLLPDIVLGWPNEVGPESAVMTGSK
jgi:cytochrome c oxidase subunit IV